MDFVGRGDIENSLQLVGELLLARGEEYAIVVLGGAAMNILGIVERSTGDVDIIAFARPQLGSEPVADSMHAPPSPIPQPLLEAAQTVASDLGLDSNWLNAESALQWRMGLPQGISGRVQWTRYAGLWVGVISRYDLIFFKLFAAADSTGTGSRHYQDLIALSPSDDELADAANWVSTQDASDVFADVLKKVVTNARKHLGFV